MMRGANCLKRRLNILNRIQLNKCFGFRLAGICRILNGHTMISCAEGRFIKKDRFSFRIVLTRRIAWGKLGE